MHKKMLVPLDGSRMSELVAEYAKELALRLDLDLILLHICGPDDYELAPLHRAYINQTVESVSHDLHEIYEWSCDKTTNKEAKARAELVMGEPSEEILRYSDEHEIDLVLMGIHGQSGGIGICTLGRVVHNVISKSSIPVWLVPARISPDLIYDEWPFRKMLVPLDGSDMAESVLPHLETLAKQRGPQLVDVVLFKICDPRSAITNKMEFEAPVTRKKKTWPDMIEIEREAERYLADIEKKLADIGINAQYKVTVGDPAKEIIGYVRRNPFNLIVISSREHSGAVPWGYGGVAHKVICGVQSPVFVVRQKSGIQSDSRLALTADRRSCNVR